MSGISKYGDFTGRQFGRWTVISPAASLGKGRRWNCQCACGVERIIAQRNLTSGLSNSCGCLSNEIHSAVRADQNRTHGQSKTPEYKIWKDMIKRCENPRNHAFKNYGARGITVCPEWRRDFNAFLAEIGPRPAPHLTVDRIDNERGYCPGNIR